MLVFTKSQVETFRHYNKAKRWGQAFYDYFKLNKICSASDKDFCERLYQERDEVRAKAMVSSRTDNSQ